MSDFNTWLANFIVEGVERFGGIDEFGAALQAYNEMKAQGRNGI